MGILACVGKKFGRNKPGVKRLMCIDMTIAGNLDCYVHRSFRAERADQLGDFLQEISKVYSVTLVGPGQAVVECRCDLEARNDLVEQCANLLGRKGLAALGNRAALQTNGATQTG